MKLMTISLWSHEQHYLFLATVYDNMHRLLSIRKTQSSLWFSLFLLGLDHKLFIWLTLSLWPHPEGKLTPSVITSFEGYNRYCVAQSPVISHSQLFFGYDL